MVRLLRALLAQIYGLRRHLMGFPVNKLKHAHSEAISKGWNVTDDASLFERLGLPVKIYDAGPSNIKVTTPFDLVIAESLLSTLKD